MKISASLLNADFTALGELVRGLEKAGADMLHIDVMDGNFVPNISIGFPVIQSLKAFTALPLDVHLMVDRPHRYIERFIEAGADTLGFHYEAGSDSGRVIRRIKELGAKPSITVCPSTPVHVLYDHLEAVSQVLIMTVQPGYGGQDFMLPMLGKVEKLRAERKRRGLDFEIQVDGGIDSETALPAKRAGADILVVGSALIGAEDMSAAIKALRT